MHEDVRDEIRRAVERDVTIALLIAAEAALSARSVTRWLAGVRVRPNTTVAIVRAWGRVATTNRTRSSRSKRAA
jgi:hypothetical protein